jgi:hypothetical protein
MDTAQSARGRQLYQANRTTEPPLYEARNRQQLLRPAIGAFGRRGTNELTSLFREGFGTCCAVQVAATAW